MPEYQSRGEFVRPDEVAIQKTLAVLLEPGQVVELRALDVSTREYTRPHIESGYFNDYDKLARAAKSLAEVARGVYITPNPVSRALLARAANRIRIPGRRDTLTTNQDIIERKWLLIDVDPIRPSGIAATKEEHQRAIAKALEMRATLLERGWPEPVVGDSGNGGHLLYSIELQNDSDACDLVRRCLEALAFLFDDRSTSVDTSVFNAARIWKLYGTVSRKGDNVPERPHRLARVLEIPATLTKVQIGQLQEFGRRTPADASRSQRNHPKGGSFDVESWIADHNLDVDGPVEWKGGKRWIFRACPWNSNHQDRSAFIVQFPTGAVAAGCHHRSCADNNWYTLRDLIEPGWRTRRSPVADQATEEPVIPPADEEEVTPFPVDVLPEAIARFVREAAGSLACPPDFVALPVLGSLASAIGISHVIRIKRDWHEAARLYIACVGDPGSLKSPALDKAARPIYEEQAKLRVEFSNAKAKYERDLAEFEGNLAARYQHGKKA
jgi:hypothetical protein